MREQKGCEGLGTVSIECCARSYVFAEECRRLKPKPRFFVPPHVAPLKRCFTRILSALSSSAEQKYVTQVTDLCGLGSQPLIRQVVIVWSIDFLTIRGGNFRRALSRRLKPAQDTN